MSFPSLKLPLSLFPQLAEYRQRKAYADSQKKQKKKKKKKSVEDSEGDLQGRVEVEPDQPVAGEDGSGGGRDGSQEGDKDPPTTEFTFTRTLQSGETVKHDQTYTIEVDTSAHSKHFSIGPRLELLLVYRAVHRSFSHVQGFTLTC